MARPIRIEYPDAVYHVMARGNQGRPVFGDPQDHKRFLETLAEACAKTGWQVHACVLMENHYHLLLQTPEPNLVEGMKWLQGTSAVQPLRWVSQRLEMGHYSRVAQAVSRMRQRPGPSLEKLRRKLLRALDRKE